MEVNPKLGSLRRELEQLINRHSLENGSDTPDFILAHYLMDCLTAFDTAVNRRNAWYSSPKNPVAIDQYGGLGTWEGVVPEPTDDDN